MTINTYSGQQLYVLTVPPQCTSMRLTLKGPGGGGLQGGAGDYVQATIPTVPGDKLYIRPGGHGTTWSSSANSGEGYNGGGKGQDGSAGGGGMTDVRMNADTLAAQILVAGGGAGRGAAGSAGGNGGANTGGAGTDGGHAGSGGAGGTQSAGGAHGTNSPGTVGTNAQDGSRGQGGNGAAAPSAGDGAGGGGGGGYYGGGGGGRCGGLDSNTGGGGAGGSGFVSATVHGIAVTSITHTRGAGSPHGVDGSVVAEFNQAPDAPSISIYNADDIDVSLPAPRAWTFSDPDSGDVQSKADARWRIGTGAWSNILNAVTSATPSYSFPAGLFVSYAGQTVEYQIKTYDALGAYSDWSASDYFTPRAHPTAPTFVSPPVLDSHNPTVTVNFPSGAYEGEFRITADVAGSPGDDIGTDQTLGYSGATSGTATLDDYITNMVNGQSYHVLVRYATYNNVWSDWVDSGPIVANIDSPFQPTLVVTPVDGTASVLIAITNPPGDPNAPDHNDVYRQDLTLGTPEVKIATGVALNSVYTDWGVGLHHVYRYRVAVVRTTGAFTFSE